MAFEDNYILGIGSKKADLTIEIIPELLACPTLEQVLFPAKLDLSARKAIWLSSHHEFSVDMIPKVFRKGDYIELYLDAKSGIALHVSFAKYFRYSWSQHGFQLEFTSKHIEEGILNTTTLKQIISEVASIFYPENIDVVHAYIESGRTTSRRPKVYHGVKIELDWFTYYSPTDLAIIGRERFDNLRTCYEKYDFMGGIMIILQEEPFDKRNPEHIARRLQAEKELGFDLLPDEPVAKK